MTNVCNSCIAFTTCEQQFLTRILTDLNLPECQVCKIIDKLCVSGTTFDIEKSKTNLYIIATDLYECLKPTANDIARITADELSKTFIYILIVTAIFIVLIAIVLIILDGNINYSWTIIISIIFGFLYIGMVFLLAYIAKNDINNQITNAQNDVKKCVKTAIQELADYENDNTNAIDNALCAYTNESVICENLI